MIRSFICGAFVLLLVIAGPVKPDLKWSTDLSAPFIWFEWIMEWIVYGFSKLAFFRILEYAAKLTILFALILYVLEIPQRKRQAELNAWQIVNSAMEQKAASGRVEALEYLNNAGVDLTLLEVSNVYLIGTTKEGETKGIKLPNAKLREADFSESTLTDANFRNADLSKANLVGADLFRANLVGANLVGADLFRANLVGANLERADLEEADLGRANLEGANLVGANLEGANLREAYLLEANLVEANLVEANLIGANLEGADLGGANLEGANLLLANLEGAENITYDPLCEAKTLYKAQLDSELREIVKEKCPELLVEPQ